MQLAVHLDVPAIPATVLHGVDRLLTINALIAAYFMFLAATSIHLVLDPAGHQTVSFMIVHYVVDIVMLLFVLLLYRAAQGQAAAHEGRADCAG